MKKAKGLSERIEALAGRIPGLGTYRDRERRRDTDKLLRDYLSKLMLESKAQLQDFSLDLIKHGKLEPMDDLDRLASHIQQISDTIKHAGYGYSGIFDVEKIGGEELDRLYEFDLSLVDDIDKLTNTIKLLKSDISSNEISVFCVRLEDVEELLFSFERKFGERSNHMAQTA